MALVVLGCVGLVVAVAVAWPFLTAEDLSGAHSPRADDRREVEESLARALAAIREIEQDRRAGSLTEEDFVALERDERARAVALLRRRDQLDA